MCVRIDPAHAYLVRVRPFDIQVVRSFVVLPRDHRSQNERGLSLRLGIAHVAKPVRASRYRQRYISRRIRPDGSSMAGEIFELCVSRKTGLYFNRSRVVGVLIESDQQMLSGTSGAEPLESEHPVVFPTLLRAPVCQMFVNPDEPVNRGLQSEAVSVRAVVTVKHAGISFGRENVRVSKHLVAHNRSADAPAVGVMILDKGHGTQRIYASQSRVV